MARPFHPLGLSRTSMTAIDLRGVTKRFPGDIVAVRDLDLTVEPGEIFGFLGPNGAGKSTTINMILDFVRPTVGEIRVLGHDAREESVAIRERTGVLPEQFDVYDRLTGHQHIEFAIESKDSRERPMDVLERVAIADVAHRKAGEYSTGMRQRLALGMALVGSPDLLILDEPSTGLDPNGALEMRSIVREESERGATIFFSSHVLGQVEAVCDRVGIMRSGRLVAVDSIDGLRDAIGDTGSLQISVAAAVDDATTEAIEALPGVSEVNQRRETDGSILIVSCDDEAKTSVLRVLEDAPVSVTDFETADASLEELFRAYTTGEPVQGVHK